MRKIAVGVRTIVSLRGILGFLIILSVLLPLYLATLQTTPNGSEHYYMIDVGETQIVLNTWGTLHATGYPLYVMTGSTLVTLLRALGVSPAAAPSLVSLVWGVLALGVIYSLQSSVLSRQSAVSGQQSAVFSSENSELGTRNSELPSALSTQHSVLSTQHFLLPALLATLLFGLTRTVWIHMVVAEIYSFGLLILALLLAVALWPNPSPGSSSHRDFLRSPYTERGLFRRRIYWLAFIGGIGVFHHRALLMAAPALLYAVWPEIIKVTSFQFPVSSSENSALSTQYSALSTSHSELGTSLSTQHSALSTQYSVLILRLLLCLALGLLGFLPYAYLPLRANAGAEWVYGQPNTWQGFWDQFLGREAERFIGPPASLDALAANFNHVNAVLLTDLTAPGLIAGVAGLLIALRNSALRRAAITLILSSLTAYVFHILLYTDILSALILPVTLSVAFGWAFLLQAVGDWLLAVGKKSSVISRQLSAFLRVGMIVVSLILGAVLVAQNAPFITGLTKDPTWQDTLALVESAPPESAAMLAWGPRYFTAAFAQEVMGKLPDVTLVDHRADFAAILNSGRMLVTPEYTFYNQPVSWWEAKLGARIYLNAVTPRLVRLKTQPEMADAPPDGIAALSQQIACTPEAIQLNVAWVSGQPPERDFSVFVHLLDADDNVIAQGDQASPVYGWRPLTTWVAGELVRDVYVLPRRSEAASVLFGLYYQAASGEFVNEVEYELPVDCG